MISRSATRRLFAAAVLAGAFAAGGAYANITITGTTAGYAGQGVDSDNDSIVATMNIGYVGGATAAMKKALGAQFGGWTFTYAPGLNGTLNINSYYPTSSGDDNGGALIDATYTRAAGDPAISNLRWIQLVTTNRPLGGGPTTGYIDPLPNDDTLPFYWTTPEDTNPADGNKTASTYHFYDNSSRTPPSDSFPTSWSGILILASYAPGTQTATIYDGISWGWTLTDGVPEPATWSLMIVAFAALGAGLRARRGARFA